MQCEVCGSEGAKKKVVIDGSELVVCNDCAKFGKEINENINIKVEQLNKYAHSEEDLKTKQLKENYGEIIRKARESKGMTIEDLAKTIFESASWIKKVEQGKLKPDDKLISKLEKALSIKLTIE